MKKLFVILILSFITVFSGCLFSSDNKEGNNIGGGGTETAGFNTYLPYKIGASWTTYEVSYYYYSSDYSTPYGPSIDTYIETIVGTRSQGGKIYWMKEYKSSYSSRPDTLLVRIEGNTVYQFFFRYPYYKSIPKTAKAAGATETVINVGGNDIPILKFGLNPLQTWTVDDESDIDLGGSVVGHYVETGKYLGIEGAQVTVPAGSFSGCAKYEFTCEVTATEKEGNWKSVVTKWYAPNVGMVKASGLKDEWGYDIGSDETLTSYTTP